MAYYGAGTLYAEPSRSTALIGAAADESRASTHPAQRPRARVRGRARPARAAAARRARCSGRAAPDWRVLARRAFHVRKLAVYFGALLVLRVVFAAGRRRQRWPRRLRVDAGAAGAGCARPGAGGADGLAVGRTTVYTLTDRRVVMRIGIVLTLTFNLPLQRIAAAGLRRTRGGSGDIALDAAGPGPHRLPAPVAARAAVAPRAGPSRCCAACRRRPGGAAAGARPGRRPPAWPQPAAAAAREPRAAGASRTQGHGQPALAARLNGRPANAMP